MNHPIATALALAALFFVPSVAASPIQTQPVDTPPFIAIRGELTNDTLEGDLVNDTLEFAKAMQNASTAEEAVNITSAFVTSQSGQLLSTLCQYFVDPDLMSITRPVILSTATDTVEWRLLTRDQWGQVAVSYHKFKYDPNDMGCDAELPPLLRPGRLIDTRTPEPLEVAGEVMRPFHSVPLIK